MINQMINSSLSFKFFEIIMFWVRFIFFNLLLGVRILSHFAWLGHLLMVFFELKIWFWTLPFHNFRLFELFFKVFQPFCHSRRATSDLLYLFSIAFSNLANDLLFLLSKKIKDRFWGRLKKIMLLKVLFEKGLVLVQRERRQFVELVAPLIQ